uniref:Uncharacterized protein n=1 Tax=Anguilla anguilla TaxID=7936 RepID=A0A0E9S899_ANGAN
MDDRCCDYGTHLIFLGLII